MVREKLPPHDIDAEEAVLGSLLIDGAAIHRISGQLDEPEYFYDERNQWLFGACLELSKRDEAINQITVAQELDRQGKLQSCGGSAYLSHLVAMVPTSIDIEHYAQIVYRLSISRRLIEAAQQIESIGYDVDPDVDSSLNRAEDVLFGIRQGKTTGDFTHIRTVLDQYLEAPLTSEEDEKVQSGSVKTFYSALDDMLGGLTPSDLVVVAGRPSMGKTTLAMNIARNAAVERGAHVGIFSLEMSCESLVNRLLASEAGVNLSHIRLGLQTEAEESRIMNAVGILSEAPIYINDNPRLRIGEMRSRSRRLQHEEGLDMLIVDHIGLMDGQQRDRVQEISFLSRSLKAVARELKIPVIAISQLSRASEWRASHRPQLSDLRDSGSIEQDADVVMFIYRDDYYFSREEWDTQFPDRDYPEGLADIIIAKHRNGPVGSVSLKYTPTLSKFENLPNQESGIL